jgi:pimeloyl-ACP methyl ester carboxylesterase
MDFIVRSDKDFKYIEEGEGKTILLLHGLFGSLSNWTEVVRTFSKDFRVIIPIMPIYEMPIRSAGLDGLVDFIASFVEYKKLEKFSIIGNSLGGHVGLIYTLKYAEKVESLTLTGSSGLFENSMGASYPRRGNYKFVKERVQHTFFDPTTASEEMVEEIFEITNSIPKCMRIVAIAKSAQRHNMAKELNKINIPTLLIWGLNDTITPPLVAHEFNRLIPQSKLSFIDHCGHAPMMEQPQKFNEAYKKFITSI